MVPALALRPACVATDWARAAPTRTNSSRELEWPTWVILESGTQVVQEGRSPKGTQDERRIRSLGLRLKKRDSWLGRWLPFEPDTYILVPYLNLSHAGEMQSQVWDPSLPTTSLPGGDPGCG